MTGEQEQRGQGGLAPVQSPKELPRGGHGGKSKLKEVLEGEGISQAGQA